MKSNILVCPGGGCPLRHTCERFHAWMDSDDGDNELEMVPYFKGGECKQYIRKQYYGDELRPQN